MLPKKYQGSIQQSSQEAVIIHENGQQDLILKVNPQINGKAAPPYFAWIVSVPNEPDSYKLASKTIFKDMYKYSRDYIAPQGDDFGESDEGSPRGVKAEGVHLSKRVQVGPYHIQPIRGVGENALKGLNKWLSTNGFPTESDEHMAYFVENNFTFLCIKVYPVKKKTFTKIPGLLPLHISFKSKDIYYPMMYSSQQGNFNAQIYTVSDKRINYTANESVLNKIGYRDRQYKRNSLLHRKTKGAPRSLLGLLSERKTKIWYYNDIACYNPNKDKNISKWDKDIFLTNSVSSQDALALFDGFHTSRQFFKAFGVADNYFKNSKGEKLGVYYLEDGKELTLKKDGKSFYKAILKEDNKTQILRSLPTSSQALAKKLSSIIPRDSQGRIFFPDDLDPKLLPSAVNTACLNFLTTIDVFDEEESTNNTKVNIISGKTFTRFYFLTVQFEKTVNYLIYDRKRKVILGNYQKNDKR